MLSLLPHSGLPLPSLRTLLVKGEYHLSAPIHLALSCVARSPDSQAVLISPSRHKLTQGLQQYNDEWLRLNSGHGSVSSLSSRVKLFFPPSPAHLCLLFSMLRVPSSTDNEAWLNEKFLLTSLPDMMILHEPSAYFLTDGDLSSSEWTVSSYISLIAHFLSSVSFLSRAEIEPSRGLSAVLFDSRIDHLKMPMYKRPKYQLFGDENTPDVRQEAVYNYVRAYFDWVASPGDTPASSIDTRRKRTMILSRGEKDGRPLRLQEWWEEVETDETGKRHSTRFSW